MTDPDTTTTRTCTTDVAIIGGGIAGLTAARALALQGVAVTLFDARPRLGGRVFTTGAAPGDAPWLDLGPAWFWPHQRHIQAELAALNLGVFAQHTSGLAMYDQGPGRPPQPFDAAGQTAPSWRVLGGTGAFADALATAATSAAVPATVRTRTVVHAVQWVGGADGADYPLQLRAVTTGESLTGATPGGEPAGQALVCAARHVIVAIPPRVALRDLTFDPPLSDHLRSTLNATVTWMGHSMKCAVAYDTPFWREAGCSGYAVSWSGPLQEIHDASMPAFGANDARHALMGFVTPTTSAERHAFRTGPVEARREAVLAQLVRIFGPAAQQASAYVECDWTRERFTSGAGDVLPPSAHPDYGAPAFTTAAQPAPWRGLLHWAGAETSVEEGGYLDGAVAAGQRTAHELVASLNRTPP